VFSGTHPWWVSREWIANRCLVVFWVGRECFRVPIPGGSVANGLPIVAWSVSIQQAIFAWIGHKRKHQRKSNPLPLAAPTKAFMLRAIGCDSLLGMCARAVANEVSFDSITQPIKALFK